MKNFKKIIAVLMVALMMLSFTGCVAQTKTNYTELTVSEAEKNPSASAYTNNFDGLVKYMKDCELIAGEGTDMSADFIGAVKGQKFAYSYSGTKITCELYEYDTENLSAEAQEIISSVKEKGYFISLDTEVKAVMSNSGKFLMIYVNNAKDDDTANQTLIARTNEKFQGFLGQ